MNSTVDVGELRSKVRDVYRDVAERPEDDYHFEMGRPLAERLGYAAADLDRIPAEAIASFAGVGYTFDLADLGPGDAVIDLGSGSGTDSFLAAHLVGPSGDVIGLDMTEAQLRKSEALRQRVAVANASFVKGFIEDLPFADASADVIISNGVINLSPNKEQVFREVARVLRPGGRLAIADMVTELPLTDGITGNASLWAACIGGAAQELDYRRMITQAGMTLEAVRDNPQYSFLSASALGATADFGVKSISLLAIKE
jgi:ubiquinone/menaquinone biosynthesis C-methylase UbiE